MTSKTTPVTTKELSTTKMKKNHDHNSTNSCKMLLTVHPQLQQRQAIVYIRRGSNIIIDLKKNKMIMKYNLTQLHSSECTLHRKKNNQIYRFIDSDNLSL